MEKILVNCAPFTPFYVTVNSIWKPIAAYAAMLARTALKVYL